MKVDELCRVLGKRLTDATGTFHVFEEHISEAPLSLWLGFDEVLFFRFTGAPDGWHLVIDEEAPVDVNVDMKSSGTLQNFNISKPDFVPHTMGMIVRHVWVTSSPGPDDIIGVRFDFESCTLRVLNWGDQICISRDLPTDVDGWEIFERRIG